MRTVDSKNMPNRNDMIAHVISLFRDTMPFNQLLGLEFVRPNESLESDSIELHVSWREALTGNPLQKFFMAA